MMGSAMYLITSKHRGDSRTKNMAMVCSSAVTYATLTLQFIPEYVKITDYTEQLS